MSSERLARRRPAPMAALALGTLLCVGATAAPGHATDAATVANAGSDRAVDGSYLVVFEDGAEPDLADAYGVRVRDTFDHALRGALIEGSARQARRLAADPGVRLVEQNTVVHRARSPKAVQSSPPSCGLDRIDQRALPLDGSYGYPRSAGRGVDVYVIDTGIDYDHPELRPRAGFGFDAFGGDGGDEHGNGTHMAGVIGGTEHGVAKKARLISVKVLDAQGGGTLAGVVAGIDWVTEHADGPSVANFVIGAPPSDVLDDAVRRSIDAGVTYAMSAGADGVDLANSSPARVAEGLTVGASDCADRVAPFSNHGKGLDLYAPGVDIPSARPGGGTATESGTSVAAAHASGAAALLLGERPHASPRAVNKALKNRAVKHTLTGVPAGTANKLLRTAR
ncbi:S8 family serine peptidase [Streptomyces coelicoflavus]|uniref:S8 family peptidase n=1 Tax=Streptomyces TaxID=1883 RepID=UPI0013F628F3|nr:S8 family peptidase [Streptomyces sp. KO7888]